MKEEIKKMINEEFHPEGISFVCSIIEKIYQKEWGIGKDQLVVSLLKLSNGSIDKLLSYFPIIDPRDIIMESP